MIISSTSNQVMSHIQLLWLQLDDTDSTWQHSFSIHEHDMENILSVHYLMSQPHIQFRDRQVTR